MVAIAARAPAQDADVAITTAKAKNGLSYHLRIPPALAGKRGARALVLLHGSNSSSKACVATAARAWPELARERVLLGIDGETKAEGSTDADPRFNYTYTEFAEELWQAAQADFQKKDAVAAKKKLEELVEKYPAATRCRAAKATLDQP